MPNERLDFNIPQGAWEPSKYNNSSGVALDFRGAAVLHGSSDFNDMYQAASDGAVYQAETGATDNGVAISVLGLTKRYSFGGYLGMPHTLFVRLEAVTADTLTVKCLVGGSEYGEIQREYSINLAGSNDLEIKVRLHRELLGRWAQIEFSGSVSNRPAIREAILRWVPIRSARVSV